MRAVRVHMGGVSTVRPPSPPDDHFSIPVEDGRPEHGLRGRSVPTQHGREAASQWIERCRRWVRFFGVRRIIHGAVVVVVATVATWWLVRPSPPPVESQIPYSSSVSSLISPSMSSSVASSGSDASAAMMRVHVTGAVKRPGVYSLSVTARVVDAMRAAGGATATADLEAINLAQTVLDTEQVHIPVRKSRTKTTVAPRHRPQSQRRQAPSGMSPSQNPSTATPGTSGGTAPDASGTGSKVNLNTADAAALDRLPGVGPSTARAIIDYRTKTGPFSKIDDLQKIDGIGPKKFAALKDLVTL